MKPIVLLTLLLLSPLASITQQESIYVPLGFSLSFHFTVFLGASRTFAVHIYNFGDPPTDYFVKTSLYFQSGDQILTLNGCSTSLEMPTIELPHPEEKIWYIVAETTDDTEGTAYWDLIIDYGPSPQDLPNSDNHTLTFYIMAHDPAPSIWTFILLFCVPFLSVIIAVIVVSVYIWKRRIPSKTPK